MQERTETYENKMLQLETPCDFLWERLNVWYDGITNPCDEDYKSILSPGTFPEKSLEDIWHGHSLNTLRKQHLNKERSCVNPCDRCGV